jgi:hypothetical protein
VYAKLFVSLYQGTLRGNSRGILVFTNLLAHCDEDGIVDIHPRAIADEVGLTVDEVRATLLELEAPDPESRTPTHDGRRILRMDDHRDWGWVIVNHAKYQAIRNREDRREQNRLSQQRSRERRSADSQQASASVSKGQPGSAESAHVDVDVDVDVDVSKSKALASQGSARPADKSASPRATRIPKDWDLSATLLMWTHEARPKWTIDDINRVLASFKDFWAAKAGKDGTKLDWDATWRVWVRREPETFERAVRKGVASMSDAELLQKATELGVSTKGLNRVQLIDKIRERT